MKIYKHQTSDTNENKKISLQKKKIHKHFKNLETKQTKIVVLFFMNSMDWPRQVYISQTHHFNHFQSSSQLAPIPPGICSVLRLKIAELQSQVD